MCAARSAAPAVARPRAWPPGRSEYPSRASGGSRRTPSWRTTPPTTAAAHRVRRIRSTAPEILAAPACLRNSSATSAPGQAATRRAAATPLAPHPSTTPGRLWRELRCRHPASEPAVAAGERRLPRLAAPSKNDAWRRPQRRQP